MIVVLILIVIGSLSLVGLTIYERVKYRKLSPKNVYPVNLLQQEISKQRQQAQDILLQVTPATKYKILILEDNRQERLQWRTWFQRDTLFYFFFAETEEEAFRYLQELSFDAVGVSIPRTTYPELVSLLQQTHTVFFQIQDQSSENEYLMNVPSLSKPFQKKDVQSLLNSLFFHITSYDLC